MEICFVTFDERYLDCSYDWLNDPTINLLTEAGQITREKQKKWFKGLNSRKDYLIWGVEADNMPVGVVGLKHISDCDAEYFGYIGEKECWGRGIGTRMIHFAIKKGNELGLKKLSLHVNAGNDRAIHLYKKMGFELKDGSIGVLLLWRKHSVS